MCADSRFAEPRKVSKGFNFVSGKLLFEWADLRFAEPRNSLQGRTDCHFLHRAKSNQKARGASPATRDSKLCRRRFQQNFPAARAEPVFRTNGGEKALNRCEVRVLLRKDLEQRLKE